MTSQLTRLSTDMIASSPPLPTSKGGTGQADLLTALTVLFNNLPTTEPSTPGQLYNNGRTICISGSGS